MQVPDNAAGRTIRCPSCSKPFVAPAPKSAGPVASVPTSRVTPNPGNRTGFKAPGPDRAKVAASPPGAKLRPHPRDDEDEEGGGKGKLLLIGGGVLLILLVGGAIFVVVGGFGKPENNGPVQVAVEEEQAEKIKRTGK